MPSAPPRLCARCHRTNCDCRKEARRQSDRWRGSAASRGYDYKWQQFRLHYLAEHPLCSDCGEQGRTKPATDVHHVKKLVDHPEYKYDEQWLMALCSECHDARTRKGE